MKALLSIQSLTKRFDGREAVSGVDLDILTGEYFCLLGPSGCGKTTLMRMVAGFETPDSGRMLLEGADLGAVPPQRRPVNMVFQQYALFPHLTVGENIVFGLVMRRAAPATRKRELARLLALTDLEGLEARYPRQLSGGQQQRVALARAIINQPALLLLDEPLAALDKHLRGQMQAELKRLQQETGITFIHVTHDQQEALSLSDRMGVMYQGRLLQAGTPAALYEQPQHPFVASFLGESNLVPVRASAGALFFSDDVPPLRYPYDQAEARWLCLIRPEHIILTAPDSVPADNTYTGNLLQVRYLGATRACEVEAGGVRWQVILPTTQPVPSPGEQVQITIPAAVITLLPPGDEADS
ncbi:MAG: ABC transporter ATP-binding protein [Bacteroidia bacterium]|nr:ABC transporter ATP-binding protein [Bacteroidia bacterium]